MNFNFNDRVCWIRLDDGGFFSDAHGTVRDVNNALEKVKVMWDDGAYGWAYMDELKHIDIVTRLGEVADGA